MITPNALAYALMYAKEAKVTDPPDIVEIAAKVTWTAEGKDIDAIEAELVEIIAERDDIEDLASLPLADTIELVEAYLA